VWIIASIVAASCVGRIYFRRETPAAICETSIQSTGRRSGQIASSDIGSKSFAGRTGSECHRCPRRLHRMLSRAVHAGSSGPGEWKIAASYDTRSPAEVLGRGCQECVPGSGVGHVLPAPHWPHSRMPRLFFRPQVNQLQPEVPAMHSPECINCNFLRQPP
jgi:hypothetical protein